MLLKVKKPLSINIVDECEIKNKFILLIRDVKISNFLITNITLYYMVIFTFVTIIKTLTLYNLHTRKVLMMMSKSLKAEV
jgi:hypothetical protein